MDSFLLALPLLLALFTPCNACMCKLPHPQTVYCSSDIVMLVNILGEGSKFRNKQGLRVSVTQIFKGPLKADEIHEIYTPPNMHTCGYLIRTSLQSDLLVAGFLTAGKIHFTRCHLVYIWAHLSLKQRLGFQLFYSKGCSCHIQPCIMCWRSCPEPDVNECTWEQKDCEFGYWMGEQTINSLCYPSKSGQCKWTTIPFSGTAITSD